MTSNFFFRVSQVIQNFFGFASRRCAIGPEKSCHLLNQSNSKLEQVASCSLAFSRALDISRVFNLSSDWLALLMFSRALNSRRGFFSFVELASFARALGCFNHTISPIGLLLLLLLLLLLSSPHKNVNEDNTHF